MLRKDAAAASALMLYRKKPEQAERAPHAFLAAPSAEASNEVRPPPVLLCLQHRVIQISLGTLCSGLLDGPNDMLIPKDGSLSANLEHEAVPTGGG